MRKQLFLTATGLAATSIVSTMTFAEIRITEYMYSGPSGEFIEVTNIGDEPVDVTGWSFDDSNRVPGAFPIGSLGVIMPGESAIITEADADEFRQAWNLTREANIVGLLGAENGNNLGRNDAINLWNQSGELIDQLVYGDQDFPGSIRTQEISGWTLAESLGTNDPYAWILSANGDVQNSVISSAGDIGNPGGFVVVGKPAADLTIAITEYMYSGNGGEFVEFTNLSNGPVDFTGWSVDDSNGVIGAFDLSAFGIVQPGESVILTEDDAETFRADWNLGPDVKVVGLLGNSTSHNIGRNDELNIYDADDQLVDRLTYGDEDFPGSIRTQEISGWAPLKSLGQNDPYAFLFSEVDDAQDSYISAAGEIGSPASYEFPKSPAGDLNDDGVVNVLDMLALLSAWGDCPADGECDADLNSDLTVDVLDLLALLSNWG